MRLGLLGKKNGRKYACAIIAICNRQVKMQLIAKDRWEITRVGIRDLQDLYVHKKSRGDLGSYIRA
jgi:hypothetical protein